MLCSQRNCCNGLSTSLNGSCLIKNPLCRTGVGSHRIHLRCIMIHRLFVCISHSDRLVGGTGQSKLLIIIIASVIIHEAHSFHLKLFCYRRFALWLVTIVRIWSDIIIPCTNWPINIYWRRLWCLELARQLCHVSCLLGRYSDRCICTHEIFGKSEWSIACVAFTEFTKLFQFIQAFVFRGHQITSDTIFPRNSSGSLKRTWFKYGICHTIIRSAERTTRSSVNIFSSSSSSSLLLLLAIVTHLYMNSIFISRNLSGFYLPPFSWRRKWIETTTKTRKKERRFETKRWKIGNSDHIEKFGIWFLSVRSACCG